MWPRRDGLRAFELGSPGPMRERLIALVLAGTKVATAGLWQQDYLDEDEPLDEVGERQALLGEDGEVVGIIEVTRVEVHPFEDVPWEFADAEGEGFESIEHWRSGHLAYYERVGLDVGPSPLMVCVWFTLVDARSGS